MFEQDIIQSIQDLKVFLRVNSVIAGQNATFTIRSVAPCSDDIFCIFRNDDNSLYAVRNTGSIAIGEVEYGQNEVVRFLLPVTKFLIERQVDCLQYFVKWCRESELPTGIPIVSESFQNPFLS